MKRPAHDPEETDPEIKSAELHLNVKIVESENIRLKEKLEAIEQENSKLKQQLQLTKNEDTLLKKQLEKADAARVQIQDRFDVLKQKFEQQGGGFGKKLFVANNFISSRFSYSFCTPKLAYDAILATYRFFHYNKGV